MNTAARKAMLTDPQDQGFRHAVQQRAEKDGHAGAAGAARAAGYLLAIRSPGTVYDQVAQEESERSREESDAHPETVIQQRLRYEFVSDGADEGAASEPHDHADDAIRRFVDHGYRGTDQESHGPQASPQRRCQYVQRRLLTLTRSPHSSGRQSAP
jgi:hypothetical protein